MQSLRTVSISMLVRIAGGCISASIVNLPVHADSLPISLPFANRAQLVERSARGADRVEVVAGALNYIETDKQEGYQAEESIPLTGSQETFVYDYRAGISAYQLNDEVENQLRRSGYQIVYRCQRFACGEFEGWKVFLGRRVSGVESSQYFVLGRKQRADTSVNFVQVYTNDIRESPRLIANVYEGELAVDIAATADGEGTIEIPFALNSAELTLGGREALRRFVAQLSSAGVSGIKRIEVAGYTDAQGTSERNHQLSTQRADVIARWLRAEEKLQGVTIVALAGGVGVDNDARPKVAAIQNNRYRKAAIKVIREANKTAEKVAAQ